MEKRLPHLYYIKMEISYDLGLLQLESPWQRNDAITFFIYRCVSLYQEFFEKIALGSMYLPQLPPLWQRLKKFYESVFEIF